MPYAQRLAELRQVLSSKKHHKIIDCLIVPHADRYQGEYILPADDRLNWLTGFTGSAGVALVLQDRAVLFVDGRYTVQAKHEVQTDLFEIVPIHDISMLAYLEKQALHAITIAYDPWLHTLQERDAWEKFAEKHHSQFHALESNPIDQLWYNRPSRPLNPVLIHPSVFAGKSIIEKTTGVKDILKKADAHGVIITSPTSLCWLLNIRGTDFNFTPVIDAMGIFYSDAPMDLFINPNKITPEVALHLDGVAVIHPEEDFAKALVDLGGKTILVDPNITPLSIVDRLSHAKAICLRSVDPCALPKAIKTSAEIRGIRQAHVRDGVALVKFFAWLHNAWLYDFEDGVVDEISAAQKLEEFRQEGECYQGPSFATIAGYGSNGAIVHYHAKPDTCRQLDGSSLFLLDSGGQYLDGTTDVTRTICLGEPTQEHKRHFTLVLKGHINLAMAKFPQGTTGSQLDAIARFPLWQEGLDYDHGTGHGVGYYLNVHEGPQSISKRCNTVALQEGMILSNEPGYYKEEHYGIRIENLVAVEKANGDYERPLLAFETLTLVPIDRKLIDEDMLIPAEWVWLNAYHQRVREILLPHLNSDTAAWLIEATEEI